MNDSMGEETNGGRHKLGILGKEESGTERHHERHAQKGNGLARDGNSRQFAFICFRTKEEAEEALKYFNNAYVDTYKITFEAARMIGDPDAPRPWSRHSLEKPENDGKGKNKARVDNALSKGSKGQEKTADVRGVADDPKFQEFLEVMQPRYKAKMWANDTTGALFARTRRRVAYHYIKKKEG